MNSRGRHTGDNSNSNSSRGHGNSNEYRTTTSSSTGLNASDEADLESFKAALKELTFNSRPVIEKLTGMAKDRARSIPGQVSRAILDNLVFSNPKLRSCFLFLIDSICKNVGEPYPTSFVKHGLVSAYLRVYGEIWSGGDEGQKRDFLRVLPTWNGVIAPEALKQIEVKLGLPISTPIHRTANTLPSSTSTTTLSQATFKLLRDLQGVFENPPGPHISGIVSEIFKRLTRSGELKRETLEELDSKAKMSDKSQIIEALKRLQQKSSSASTITSTSTPTENNTPTITNSPPSLNFELPPNFQIDLSLLSSIVELNKLNTATSSNSTLTSAPQSPIINKQSKDKHFVEIPVNSADLLTIRPNLHQILYTDLSLQCKTCAIRFRDTPRGQERMTEHLDSHFRRNMRLKEKSKRVMARDWFGSEEDWIAAKQDSEASSERAINIFEDSSMISGGDSQTTQNELLFVEATEEEQSEPVKCDTCQETVSLLWNDETEQWTFPSCIRNEFGKILHATCGNSVATENEKIDPPSKRLKKN